MPLLAMMMPVGADAAVPAGFRDELVATVASPTGLAFAPEGRLLATSQPGILYVKRETAAQPTIGLNLSARICSNKERGLLGVAVDPAFASNRFIYLYYTFKKFPNAPATGDTPVGCPLNSPQSPVNRVSRFVLSPNDRVAPASEVILINNIPSPNGNHNGGDLQFGKDGNLYVSVGDGGCSLTDSRACAPNNTNARQDNLLLGKILRITRTGAIPADNPFQGTDSRRCNRDGRTETGLTCAETFATGLRNPFRIAFDPDVPSTRFFINDTGQNHWEEVDLGRAGADYGWNIREGRCVTGSTTECGPPPAGLTNPIHSYQHGTCNAITGGAFVPNRVWAPAYDTSYLYADITCDTIFRLQPLAGGGFQRTVFATGVGRAVALAFGPDGTDQALYYSSYTNGGEVHLVTDAPA